jgi:hypothetical protein
LPTSIKILMNFSSGFFIFKNLKLALKFLKIKKTLMSVAHQDFICGSGLLGMQDCLFRQE